MLFLSVQLPNVVLDSFVEAFSVARVRCAPRTFFFRWPLNFALSHWS